MKVSELFLDKKEIDFIQNHFVVSRFMELNEMPDDLVTQIRLLVNYFGGDRSDRICGIFKDENIDGVVEVNGLKGEAIALDRGVHTRRIQDSLVVARVSVEDSRTVIRGEMY